MPQMGPLPWVSIWLFSLVVVFAFVVLVYFVSTVSSSKYSKVSVNITPMWSW